MHLLNGLFLSLAFATSVSATSIIFPAFSLPIVKDGTLIVLAPDRMRLVAISTTGVQRWESKLCQRTSLASHGAEVFVLSGAAVSSLNPGDGSMRPLFDAPKMSRLFYSEAADVFIGRPPENKDMVLEVLVGPDGKALCSVANRETLAYGVPISLSWLARHESRWRTVIRSVEAGLRPIGGPTATKCGQLSLSSARIPITGRRKSDPG